jgi:hypothetical protein
VSITPVTYLPRVVDDELTGALRRIGAVLVEGPKACGKTLTATQVARTVVRLDDESGRVRDALDVDPSMLLQGETPGKAEGPRGHDVRGASPSVASQS